MATMTGIALCLECNAVFHQRSQLSISRPHSRVSLTGDADPRREIKTQFGFVGTKMGSRRAKQRAFGLAPSASAAVFGTRMQPRFYGSEGFGFGPSTTGRSTSRGVVAQAGKNGIQAPERVIAALGYVLPFFDGIQYGRYFFLQYPVAESLLRPLYPLLSAYKGFPYSNFIAFFSLYLLVVRNPSISRYVRFNAMQAVVLDVLLILPTLVERTFAPRGGLGFELLVIFYNTVFLFLVACFLFGVVSCILGKTPRLPIVADAADAQV